MSNSYPYNDLAISLNVPHSPGVYLIQSVDGTHIYVGLAEASIRDRLLQHCGGSSMQAYCINQWSPATFQFLVIFDRELRWARERELRFALGPRCNRQ